jgi:hypothetical protein
VASGPTGGNTGALAVSVTGGTLPSGKPNDVTTPWMVSTLLTGGTGAAPAPTGVATTAAKGSSNPVAIVAVIAAVAVIAGAGVLISRRRRDRADPSV